MSEFLSDAAKGGPIELINGVCDLAEAYDAYILDLDEFPVDEIDAYKQGAYALEEGNPALGMTVIMEGHIATPVLDDDGDARGLAVSDKVDQVKGVYRGLEVVKLGHLNADGSEENKYRVVHYVETESGTMYDEVGTKLDQKMFTFAVAEGAQIKPFGLTNAHSFEYIDGNATASSLAQSIDVIAFDDAPSDRRVERLCELLATNMRDILNDDELFQNIYSYINSLGLLSGVSISTTVGIIDKGEEQELAQCDDDTYMDFERVEGMCTYNKLGVADDGQPQLLNEPGLCFVVVSEQYGQLLVPVDPETTVIETNSHVRSVTDGGTQQ